MKPLGLIALLAAAALSACSSQPDYRAQKTAPPTVPQVDLQRYAGLWYEIARYPNRFETNCAGVTAEYAPRDDGRIDVINTCHEGSVDGPVEIAKGVARVMEQSGNARLKVKFAPSWVPFAWGDYWILHLEPDYSAVLVGDPGGKYLWILAREKTLSAGTLTRIKTRAEELGYQTAPLEMTDQG
ncbi:lipocalin family protein [Hyphomonas sp.]|uniref:lipocalin family protein n=1 Tax=Hyphomonas sp. TaxID=87 RepID=UPI003D2AEAAF